MFDYSRQPGMFLKKIEYEKKGNNKITVIIPYYNDSEHIEQTVISILNQTFPLFELLIIDDGSTKKEALDKLDYIATLDSRIKIIHKENTGVSDTRDYGAKLASRETEYFVFCDSDDLLDKTYLECGYLTLESNKNASFAYTDAVCFDQAESLINRYFDSEVMKYENLLVNSNIIRKKDFFSVGGYEYKEKKIYEDWNLWLKLIANKMYPVKMNYYGCWYRVKKSGEFILSKNTNNKRAMQIIKSTSKKINDVVYAISYPRFLKEDINSKFCTDFKYKDCGRIVILNDCSIDDIDFCNKTVLSTVVDDSSFRQKVELSAREYFNLTTFLDQTYWNAFLQYIIKTRRIKENLKITFPNEENYKEECDKYNKKYHYPDLETLRFFHSHLKLYNFKIKFDKFSQKYNFYDYNIKLQKKVFKLIKKVKK